MCHRKIPRKANSLMIERAYQFLARWCPGEVKSIIRRSKNIIHSYLSSDIKKTLKKLYISKNYEGSFESKIKNYIGEKETCILSNKIIKSYVKIRSKNTYKINLKEEKILKHLNGVKSNSKGIKEWENMYEALLLSGLFESCCIVREKMKDRIYNVLGNGKHNKNFLAKSIAASFEDRLAKINTNIYKRIQDKKLLSNTAKRRYEFYNAIVKKNKNKLRDISETYISSLGLEIKKYARSKSVAIVGPAQSKKDYSRAIDSHDIVVRFNSLSDRVEDEKKGGETDIVYYTGAIAEKVARGELGYPEDAEWFVVRGGSHVEELEQRSGIPSRRSIGQFAFFHGVPNMVPLAVFDLLHFMPSKISVYGANLYVDTELYSEGYLTSNSSYDPVRLIESFAAHDCLANFKFMKNMYELGYIAPARELKKVLEMSDQEYMRALKHIHLERSGEPSTHA